MPDDTDSRDEERILADPDAKRRANRQIILSFLNGVAITTTTVTGLTLAAMLGFSGAVWTNPSTPMLRICADALHWLSIAFVLSITGYTLERLATYLEIRFRSIKIPLIIRKSLIYATIIFLTLSLQMYFLVGNNALKDIIAAFRNEARLYNSEASVKSKSPDNEPVELKSFGEFCKPTRFGNFCAPD